MLIEWLGIHRGPTLANVFLVEFEKKIGHKTLHQGLNLVITGVIFFIFLAQQIIQKLSEYSRLSLNMRLNNKKSPFRTFKLKMKCEDGTFTISAYHKQT